MTIRSGMSIRCERMALWTIGLIGSLWSTELQAGPPVVTPPVKAAPDEPPDKLFQEGKGLMDLGQYTEACKKFAESFKLDPSGGTILHLAACHRADGKGLIAWTELQDALRFARRDGRKDREVVAQTLLAELAETLPKISLQVVEEMVGLPDLEVSIDGVLILPEHYSAEIPVDAGGHTIVASAHGRKIEWIAVDVGAKPLTVIVTITALEPVQMGELYDPAHFYPIPQKVSVSTEAVTITGGSRARVETQTGKTIVHPFVEADLPLGPKRAVGAVLGGVGLAALGVGMGYGVRAIMKSSQSEPHCQNNACTSYGRELRSDEATSRDICAVGLIVGAMTSAAGVALWTLSSPSTADASLPQSTTSLGIDGHGVWLAGSF